MLSVETARARILGRLRPMGARDVSIQETLGRVLARPLSAREPSPPWDNSAVDGYALHAKDLSRSVPFSLRVTDTLHAGGWPQVSLSPGTALRIMTGAPVPPGTCAVVMQENTSAGQNKNEVFVQVSAESGDNIRRKGEDFKKGQKLLSPGTILGPAALGLAASCGMERLWVVPQPRVAVFSTGDELQSGAGFLKKGKIRDSNSTLLNAMVSGCGAEPMPLNAVPDRPQTLERALSRAFSLADAVVTTGGVSVGEADYVQRVLRRMGARIQFWKVDMKPGKPFLFAMLRGKPFFGLPGNPVSAFVTFQLFVRPALQKMAGLPPQGLAPVQAKLSHALSVKSSRRSFMRAQIKGDSLRVLSGQGSHQLSVLARANALVDVPSGNVNWSKGRKVSAFLLNF